MHSKPQTEWLKRNASKTGMPLLAFQGDPCSFKLALGKKAVFPENTNMQEKPIAVPSPANNRRKFIKQASTLSAGAALAGASELWLPRVQSQEQKRLGYALVGLGGLSTNQIAPGLQKTKNSFLAGIVSGTPAKIKKWSTQYNIPAKNCYNYDNYDQIASNPDIDVVYIVLPNGMHAEYTIRAAGAGKHVLCEKPMANSASDCQAMIQACKDAGKKLAVGYRCQFEPNNLECMRLAREKVFGDLRMIDAGFGFRIGNPDQWRLKSKLAGGGALMDVGIYALQACRFLTGEEPIEISAQESKTDPVKFAEVDESIVWNMRFPSGVLAYCSTTYKFSGINRFHAHCDKGWFSLDPAYSYGGIKGKTSHGEAIEKPSIDQFAGEMDAFSKCVLEDRESKVSGTEGWRDLKAIEAIYRSIRTGRTAKV
ncbi:MAG: Gfo/Idh/MocA family oxidoreductase [Verrucomicrobiota bacterium]|nr:Gfo/Idh/MocA family oxidoreductase [Verrucomicrobiota bacterium]